MFILLACVQKQFAANRKLYVDFTDFEKALDSINIIFIAMFCYRVVSKESYLDVLKVCTVT